MWHTVIVGLNVFICQFVVSFFKSFEISHKIESSHNIVISFYIKFQVVLVYLHKFVILNVTKPQ